MRKVEDTAKILNKSFSSSKSKSATNSEDENRDDTQFSDVKKRDISSEEDITLYLNNSEQIYCRDKEKDCINNFLYDNKKRGYIYRDSLGQERHFFCLRLY